MVLGEGQKKLLVREVSLTPPNPKSLSLCCPHRCPHGNPCQGLLPRPHPPPPPRFCRVDINNNHGDGRHRALSPLLHPAQQQRSAALWGVWGRAIGLSLVPLCGGLQRSPSLPSWSPPPGRRGLVKMMIMASSTTGGGCSAHPSLYR